MNSKIIGKLKKIIAHAESAKKIGSIAEAQVFAEKIQELLDTHNLSMSQIDIDSDESTIMQTHTQYKTNHNWQIRLVVTFAKLNGCRMLTINKCISLVGTSTDKVIVLELYNYFEKLAQDLARMALIKWQRTDEYKRKRKKAFHSKKFKTSFLDGFCFSLISRFKEKHEANKHSSSNTTALMFIGNKIDKTNEWIRKNLDFNLKTIKSPNFSAIHARAYLEGKKAGQDVALTTKTI